MCHIGSSTVTNITKPTMQETRVQSLGWEDLLEKEMATHSSILAWKISWRKSLVGYSPWGCKESDTTEPLFIFFISFQCSVQLLGRVQLFMIPWTAHQASLSITNSWSLLKLMPTESVMWSNHFIFCCPLPLLPSIFPSIKVFTN